MLTGSTLPHPFLLSSSAMNPLKISPQPCPEQQPTLFFPPSHYLCILSATASANSVQAGPAWTLCCPCSWVGWQRPWHFLETESSKTHPAKLLQSGEQEGFTRGLQKSENTEIYSRCHFLGGQGLWNVSGIIMTSLLSTHPSLHDCLEMEEIYAS